MPKIETSRTVTITFDKEDYEKFRAWMTAFYGVSQDSLMRDEAREFDEFFENLPTAD